MMKSSYHLLIKILSFSYEFLLFLSKKNFRNFLTTKLALRNSWDAENISIGQSSKLELHPILFSFYWYYCIVSLKFILWVIINLLIMFRLLLSTKGLLLILLSPQGDYYWYFYSLSNISLNDDNAIAIFFIILFSSPLSGCSRNEYNK